MGNIFKHIYGTFRSDSRGTSPPEIIPRPITPRPPRPKPIPITPPRPITPRPPKPKPVPITPPRPITPRPNDSWNSSSPPGNPPPGGVILPPSGKTPKFPQECCFMMVMTELTLKEKSTDGIPVSVVINGTQSATCTCLPCTSMDTEGKPDMSMQSRLLNESSIGKKKLVKTYLSSTWTEQIMKISTMCDTKCACAQDIPATDSDVKKKEIDCDKTGEAKLDTVTIRKGKQFAAYKKTEFGRAKLYTPTINGSVGIWPTLQNGNLGEDKNQTEIIVGGSGRSAKKIKLKFGCVKAKTKCS